MKTVEKILKVQTHRKSDTSRSQGINFRMAGEVHSCDARLPNSLHEELRAPVSDDPSISAM
jgi:hypothetical protein